MNREEVQNLLAQLIFDEGLSEEQKSAVEQYLGEHPEDRQLFQEMQRTAQLLQEAADRAPAMHLSPHRRRALLEQVQREQRPGLRRRRLRLVGGISAVNLWAKPWFSAGLVAAALVVLGVMTSLVMLQRQEPESNAGPMVDGTAGDRIDEMPLAALDQKEAKDRSAPTVGFGMTGGQSGSADDGHAMGPAAPPATAGAALGEAPADRLDDAAAGAKGAELASVPERSALAFRGEANAPAGALSAAAAREKEDQDQAAGQAPASVASSMTASSPPAAQPAAPAPAAEPSALAKAAGAHDAVADQKKQLADSAPTGASNKLKEQRPRQEQAQPVTAGVSEELDRLALRAQMLDRVGGRRDQAVEQRIAPQEDPGAAPMPADLVVMEVAPPPTATDGPIADKDLEQSLATRAAAQWSKSTLLIDGLWHSGKTTTASALPLDGEMRSWQQTTATLSRGKWPSAIQIDQEEFIAALQLGPQDQEAAAVQVSSGPVTVQVSGGPDPFNAGKMLLQIRISAHARPALQGPAGNPAAAMAAEATQEVMTKAQTVPAEKARAAGVTLPSGPALARDVLGQVRFEGAMVGRYRLCTGTPPAGDGRTGVGAMAAGGVAGAGGGASVAGPPAASGGVLRDGQSLLLQYELELTGPAGQAGAASLGTLRLSFEDVQARHPQQVSLSIPAAIIMARTPDQAPQFHLTAAAAQLAQALAQPPDRQRLAAINPVVSQLRQSHPKAAAIVELERALTQAIRQAPRTGNRR